MLETTNPLDQRENAQDESLRRRLETNAAYRELLHEDILSMYRRGAVPLTIASKVNRSEEYVLQALAKAGVKVPRWLRNDLAGCALGRHDGNEVPPL